MRKDVNLAATVSFSKKKQSSLKIQRSTLSGNCMRGCLSCRLSMLIHILLCTVLIGRNTRLARLSVRPLVLCKTAKQNQNLCERSPGHEHNRCTNFQFKASKVKGTAAQYVGTEPTYFSSCCTVPSNAARMFTV